MPKVLNKRVDVIPADAVYVGRPSKFGNPFEIGKPLMRGGEVVVERMNRNDVITMYVIESFPSEEDFRELRGKDLGCWCAPEACHADILLSWANRPTEQEDHSELSEW